MNKNNDYYDSLIWVKDGKEVYSSKSSASEAVTRRKQIMRSNHPSNLVNAPVVAYNVFKLDD